MEASEKKITQENFEAVYEDAIEVERIDKFVCDEMARQIQDDPELVARISQAAETAAMKINARSEEDG